MAFLRTEPRTQNVINQDVFMPRPPKDPKTRQRRNRDTSAASLIDTSPLTDGSPELPARFDGEGNEISWRQESEILWSEIWSSPMATEYTQGDVHRVLLYVDLWDRYWDKPSTALAAELRLQGVCLGVTPIDRRRLQWEIKRAEPEGKKEPPKRPDRQGDPRAGLRAVK